MVAVWAIPVGCFPKTSYWWASSRSLLPTTTGMWHKNKTLLWAHGSSWKMQRNRVRTGSLCLLSAPRIHGSQSRKIEESTGCDYECVKKINEENKKHSNINMQHKLIQHLGKGHILHWCLRSWGLLVWLSFLLPIGLYLQLSPLLFPFQCQSIGLLNAPHNGSSWTTAGLLCLITGADGRAVTISLEMRNMLRIWILSYLYSSF